MYTVFKTIIISIYLTGKYVCSGYDLKLQFMLRLYSCSLSNVEYSSLQLLSGPLFIRVLSVSYIEMFNLLVVVIISNLKLFNCVQIVRKR